MLGGNTPVTIWNRLGEKYYRTEVSTLCRCRQKTDLLRSGVGESMVASIVSSLVFVIPLLDNYLPPFEWQELEDKTGRFTIKVEDYMAMGLHEYEIGDGGLTVPKLKQKLPGQFVEIKAVGYNLYAHLGKHIRAWGV